ncbi:MAG: hypothetical protein Q9171_004536 [Xanthocarpia ochracea]
MARLNESSAPIESVEALKRRFVRQNREIARVNSTQSIRIRSLESEISRLLSENIALREEVIRLQFEIDNNGSSGNFSTVKGRLETKLLELGALVQELGNNQKSTEERRALRRKSGVKVSPRTSPDQRNWKNALTISEVTGGADGRLPPIVEGKYYPRKTLDADELAGLLSTSGDPADSPDLGPPPIAHFDAGDPIKFDANQQDTLMPVRVEKEGDLNPALFANLETRRKRRESSQLRDSTTFEPSDMPTSQGKELGDHIRPRYAMKSGAKRKFTAREEEEQVEDATAPEADNFLYNRSTIVAQSDIEGGTKLGSSQLEKQAVQAKFEGFTTQRDRLHGKPKTNNTSAHNCRNVLAPKSVNTDPVSSPVKPRRPGEGEKVARPSHDVASKPRERNRSKEQLPSQRFGRSVQASELAVADAKANSHSVPPPSRPAPETPAPPSLDALSPNGSEPPAARPTSRDTPPPEDLDPETANTNSFGSMGRSSRRQRGSVSYAEPNLRDKMRRPTKDLVDAVAAEERLQQKKNIKNEIEEEGTEPLVTGEAPSKMRTVVIKREPTDDVPDWKAAPSKGLENDHDGLRAEAPSPLRNQAPSVQANLPDSVVTERRRRPSILERERQRDDNRPQDSGAGLAIAALMTDNVKAKSRDNKTGTTESHRASRVAEPPDIYEVPESSPAEAENPPAKTTEMKPMHSLEGLRGEKKGIMTADLLAELGYPRISKMQEAQWRLGLRLEKGDKEEEKERRVDEGA